MRESELHTAICQYLALALPRSAVLHHSPNEGKRGWKAQRDLKTHGTKAGWPDLEIIYEGRAYFIELKSTKGDTTPVQKSMHTQLRDAGCPVMVCRSLAEVAITLQAWTIPSRGRIAA